MVNNGPFRIVDRTGTTTIYLNSGPSDFTNPATFSQGMPIQVSNYHQQVILNTGTNAFLTVHTNTVTHVETFTLDGVAYRWALGKVVPHQLLGAVKRARSSALWLVCGDFNPAGHLCFKELESSPTNSNGLPLTNRREP